ncbi:alpha-N-acetylgalactosaminide alpha-2,6-sialyltransferase 5b [Eucyclogobius newberryi]|uniref:alpha-N-acetylgalactosaminide alpha-2,6-sialyltransferase 5b n=1 Tax=Eucyclogobius newberryi TaxID=166745 RepID=UPI003B593E4A
MRIKVCQGVSGILAVTMVTSLMLVYKGIYSDSAPMPPTPTHGSPPAPGAAVKSQDKVTEPVLQGYTAVLDRKPLKMYCKTCALVTSSGQLVGKNMGEEIDQSQCVIRMNDAPTHGFQKDVGRRTTVRVIAHSSLQRVLRNRQQLLNSSQDTVFIHWGPSHLMRRDGKGHVYNSLRLLKHVMPTLNIYTISPIQMLKMDELFKKETGIDRKISNLWLSTGWFTMATALELCDRISVFGMVPPDYCNSSLRHSVPYHYYEPSGPEECSLYLSHEKRRKWSHHFITEKIVFSNWAQILNIDFHQPEWGPSAVRDSSSTAVPAGS